MDFGQTNVFFIIPRRAFASVLLVRFLLVEPYGMIVYGGVPLWVPAVSGLMWAILYGAAYMEREIKNANANVLFLMFCAVFHVLAILYQLLIIHALCTSNAALVYLTDAVIFLISLIALVVAYLMTVFWPATPVSMTFVFRSKTPTNEPRNPSSSDDKSN